MVQSIGVEVACVSTLGEAEVLCSLLRSCGIEARVAEEPSSRPAITGHRVFVAAEQAVEAQEILSAPFDDPEGQFAP